MDDGRRKLLLNSDPSLYAMLVILLANDIATNPGPYNTKSNTPVLFVIKLLNMDSRLLSVRTVKHGFIGSVWV